MGRGRDSPMKLAVKYASSVADGTLKGAIQYCKDLEVDRLVMRFPDIPGFEEKGYLDLATAKSVKGELEDAGMVLPMMVAYAQKTMVMGAPEGEAQFANLCKSMDAMAGIGQDLLSIFVSLDRPEDPSEEDARWGLLVDFYRKLMAQAEDCAIKIAVHTVGRPKTNMLWDCKAVQRLMRDVPSPYNGLTFCVGNFWLSEGAEMYDAIRHLGEKIFVVHVRSTKQGLGETPFWFDSGGPDFFKMMQALRDIDYHGELVPEHMPSVVGENRSDIGTAWGIGYMKALLQCF
jgi:D-mannonate dehydratase